MRPCLGVAALAILLTLGITSTAVAGGEVGTMAPDPGITAWYNVDGPMSWDQLKGQVILLEKWATW